MFVLSAKVFVYSAVSWFKSRLFQPNEDRLRTFFENVNGNYPEVATVDETIDAVVNHQKSIARLWDGEFHLCEYRSIGFQQRNLRLRNRLLEVLRNVNPDCMVAIPRVRTHHLTNHWKVFWYESLNTVSQMLDLESGTYYSSGISRESNLDQMIRLSEIWRSRDVVFVSGKGSRFDPEHELFASIKDYVMVFGLPKDAGQSTMIYWLE